MLINSKCVIYRFILTPFKCVILPRYPIQGPRMHLRPLPRLQLLQWWMRTVCSNSNKRPHNNPQHLGELDSPLLSFSCCAICLATISLIKTFSKIHCLFPLSTHGNSRTSIIQFILYSIAFRFGDYNTSAQNAYAQYGASLAPSAAYQFPSQASQISARMFFFDIDSCRDLTVSIQIQIEFSRPIHHSRLSLSNSFFIFNISLFSFSTSRLSGTNSQHRRRLCRRFTVRRSGGQSCLQ